MRRAKSLRIGVHHANGVVWGPVCSTSRQADELARFHLERGRGVERGVHGRGRDVLAGRYSSLRARLEVGSTVAVGARSCREARLDDVERTRSERDLARGRGWDARAMGRRARRSSASVGVRT